MSAFLLNEATDSNSYDEKLLIDVTKPQASTLETQLRSETEQSILPLGKALHMLLHVKPHVLAAAMDEAWKTSTKTMTTILTASPVAKALMSLDLYLTEHTDDSFLRHIYDPLKSKILKPKDGKNTNSNSLQLLAGLLLWSPHQTRYQQWIEQELIHTDKRGALSSVLLLSFITKQWHPLDNNPMESSQVDQLVMMIRYISSLMAVMEKYGELPTLLACTTYDTLLALSVYMMDAFLSPVTTVAEHDKPSNTKISVIEDEKEDQVDSDRLKWIQDLWPRLDSLMVMVKKWQQPTDIITNGAWNELHTFMSNAYHVLLGTCFGGYQQVRKSWYWLSKVLVSSQILSKNPTKKLAFIWKLEDKYLEPNLSTYLKMLMLALRQNGHWLQHSGTSLSDFIGDEQLFQQQIRLYCRSMIEGYPMHDPWTRLNQTMIPTIMTSAPHLYLPCDIPLSVHSLLLDFPWDDDATGIHLSTLADCFLSQPHDTIPLLVSKIQPDNGRETTNSGEQDQTTSNLSCRILDSIIDKIATVSSLDSCILFERMANELLTRAFLSNKSCELLLRCLPYIRKSTLVLFLMKKMMTAENERTNHVAKGLIAKTLLVDSWCGDSVIVYIDLAREFLRTRQHQTIFRSMTMTKGASPDDIYHIYDNSGKSKQEVDGMRLGNKEELGNIEIELLWPIQLWSSKVDPVVLERIIPLLINKYYNTPSESIFIHVWQMLAHTITRQKSLILAIVTKCTEIMENQKSLFELIRRGTVHKDDIDFFTLLHPILILSIFPRIAFEHVVLPANTIQKWHGRWPPGQRCKTAESATDDNELRLYSRLANELLLRYDYSGQIDGIQQIQKLTLDTLSKVFYHQ